MLANGRPGASTSTSSLSASDLELHWPGRGPPRWEPGTGERPRPRRNRGPSPGWSPIVGVCRLRAANGKRTWPNVERSLGASEAAFDVWPPKTERAGQGKRRYSDPPRSARWGDALVRVVPRARGGSSDRSTAWSPISVNRGRGRGGVHFGRIGDGNGERPRPRANRGRGSPVPGQIGDGDRCTRL